MGRVRRQRKFKACDPFSKKKPAKDDTFDRAPTKKELKDDDHFKETASFHKFQQSLDRAAQKTRKGRDFNKKDMTPSDETSILSKEKNMKAQKTPKKTEETKKTTEKLPNESEKQYFDRLDKDIQDALTAAYSSGKTMRKKRKHIAHGVLADDIEK